VEHGRLPVMQPVNRAVPWSGCRQVDFYVLKKSATIVMLWLDILWLLLIKSMQPYEIKCLY
jgi:hypothetical protein